MKWMCRAQDTVGRCRQSRLPAFNAGAMNKEKGRHSMPHNERCENPIISGETAKKERLYHSRTTDETRAVNLICRERKKKPACLVVVNTAEA